VYSIVCVLDAMRRVACAVGRRERRERRRVVSFAVGFIVGDGAVCVRKAARAGLLSILGGYSLGCNRSQVSGVKCQVIVAVVEDPGAPLSIRARARPLSSLLPSITNQRAPKPFMPLHQSHIVPTASPSPAHPPFATALCPLHLCSPGRRCGPSAKLSNGHGHAPTFVLDVSGRRAKFNCRPRPGRRPCRLFLSWVPSGILAVALWARCTWPGGQFGWAAGTRAADGRGCGERERAELPSAGLGDAVRGLVGSRLHGRDLPYFTVSRRKEARSRWRDRRSAWKKGFAQYPFPRGLHGRFWRGLGGSLRSSDTRGLPRVPFRPRKR
jgi:hypothetical protein